VDWHIEKLGPWRAAYTEVSFGGAGAPPSPPGRAEPITLSTPHGPVRLRGRIDRIDLADEGEPGYQVIDYKSGGAPSRRAMETGTSFQLPIYLWAAEALLAGGERGGRRQAFFLPIRHPARTALLASQDAKGKPNENYSAAMNRAAEYITNFIDAMRLGLYPVYPRDGCSGVCDFEGLCRYAEWRVERKWELNPIEQLRSLADTGEDDEEADA
jgi:hypothetical protein